MLVDDPSPVVLSECSQDSKLQLQQQWIYTDDGLLTLANNTSPFPAAPPFLLTLTEMYILDLCLDAGNNTDNSQIGTDRKSVV